MNEPYAIQSISRYNSRNIHTLTLNLAVCTRAPLLPKCCVRAERTRTRSGSPQRLPAGNETNGTITCRGLETGIAVVHLYVFSKWMSHGRYIRIVIVFRLFKEIEFSMCFFFAVRLWNKLKWRECG